MKHISQLLPQRSRTSSGRALILPEKSSPPQITLSASSNTASKAKWIDKLFAKFAAYYGHVWRSQFKDESFLIFAKGEWGAGLNDFSGAVLDKAILYCRDFYEMPPTLPQVIACCRQIRKNLNFYVVRDDIPCAKPAVVALHIQRCKELLTPTIKRTPSC